MTALRWVGWLTGINVLLLAVVLAHSQGPSPAEVPEIVRARAIELVDERGQIRAQLEVESTGEAVLRLRDSRGQIRVKLGAGGNGSGLLLLDASTEPAIHLLADGSGTSVSLTSKDGQRRTITP